MSIFGRTNLTHFETEANARGTCAFSAPLYRPNLHYSVLPKAGPVVKLIAHRLVHFVLTWFDLNRNSLPLPKWPSLRWRNTFKRITCRSSKLGIAYVAELH